MKKTIDGITCGEENGKRLVLSKQIFQIKTQFNILKYSNLNLEALETIKYMMIYRMHESWRKFRLVEGTEDTYWARWKETEDSEFIDYWSDILDSGDAIHIRKTKKGKVQLDIANSTPSQLTPMWLNKNRKSALFCYEILIGNLESGGEINEEFFEDSGVKVHDFWLRNNTRAKDHFIMGLSGQTVLECSKGQISNNLIEAVRTNRSAHAKWEEEGYEERFEENILEASDENIKVFIQEQAGIDIKKDIDVMNYIIDSVYFVTGKLDLEAKEKKDYIIQDALFRFHKNRRSNRILVNTDYRFSETTYMNQWKNPLDKKFDNLYGEYLTNGDSIHVKKDEKGTIMVDIANTSSNMMSSTWIDTNGKSAWFILEKIIDRLSQGKSLDTEFVVSVGLQMHDFWLANNQGAANDFIMGKTGEQLWDIANGYVSEKQIGDLIENKFAKKSFKEKYGYGIEKASDEAKREFYIDEAVFDLRKDFDIVVMGVNYINDLHLDKSDMIGELTKYKNGIVEFLANQDKIVDYYGLINAGQKVRPFIHDLGFDFQKASDFQINGLPANQRTKLCTTYENLCKISPKLLKELGIEEAQSLEEFEKYKVYVKHLQAKVEQFIQDVQEDKTVLASFMDEVSKKVSVSPIGTLLDESKAIVDGNHRDVPIKGKLRIMEKLLAPGYFDGDLRRLGDVVRGTLEFDNVYDLYDGMKALLQFDYFKKQGVEIFIKDNIGNSLADPPHFQKYRDINCIIKMGNGHIVELQFQVRPMLQANSKGIRLSKGTVENLQFSQEEREYAIKLASKIKKSTIRLPNEDFVIGHEIYELWRSIPSNDQEMSVLKDKLNDLLIVVHETAWEKAIL